MTTIQTLRSVAIAAILAAGAGLAAPSHAVPANGQAIADGVAGSAAIVRVNQVCGWGCPKRKTKTNQSQPASKPK
jgi:hypothetical protein